MIGNGKIPHDMLQAREHPFLSLVPHRAVDGPARGNILHRQGEAVLSGGVPAVVGDQVDLDESGALGSGPVLCTSC